MSSRTDNAKRNIITGLINKFLSILMPFAVRTIIIKELGMEYGGLDNLFVSILQVLNLSELGFSSAVVYCMYKPISENDNDTISALYGFFKKAYNVIGIIILISGIIVTPFLKYLIKDDVPNAINIYVLYFVYLLNTVISYLLFSYKNVLLNAYQRIDVTNNILTFVRTIMYSVQIILLVVFKNYYVYVMIIPACTIINNILTSIVVNKLFPNIKPIGRLNSELKKEIKYQVSGLFIGKVCVVSRNSFDSIIVSAYFGLISTAMYNNYYYIMNAVVSVMTILCNSIVPGIGNSIAVETQEKNYMDFRKINFIYLWVVGWCTVSLLCLYQPFMKIWMKDDKLLFNFGTVVLFCVYFFALMMGNIRATYSEAAGLWWQNRYRSIAEAVANLILNVVLGKIMGINGILLATLITIVVVNFGMSSKILFDHYFTKISIMNYFKDITLYAIVTFVASIITYYLCSFVKLTYIYQIVINGVICLIIPNCIFILLYMRTDNFKTAKLWIKGIFLKK